MSGDCNIKDLLMGIIEGSINPMACVEVLTKDGEDAIRFMLFNYAFRNLMGEDITAMTENVIKLSEISQMNQNDAISTAILEVCRGGEPVYSIIDIPYLERTFKLKAFVPYDGYVCIILADVTEFEKAKKDAYEMYNLANSTSEQLKYQVDLLQATQKQIERTSRIHELVAKAASDGFYYKNYSNESFFASESWYNLFTCDGVRPFDSKNIVNCVLEEDVFSYTRWREKAIMDVKDSATIEFRLADSVTWIQASFRFYYDDSNKLKEEIGFFKDITTIKMQKEELAYNAYYDTATGLINRTYLIKLLDEDIKRAREEDVAIEVIYIDIDNFKDINDSIGYKMADEFIIKFAMMLKKYENETTRVARFDSDEFVITVYDGTRHGAQGIAMDIRKRLSEPVALSNGLTQRMSVSIGINQYPDGGRKAMDLVGNADIALHRVKNSGKNGILFFEQSMLEEFLIKIEMENTIKHALLEDKFVLYYQPQYYTSSRKLRGMEALIRLKDDVLGFIPPAQFIPLAEKNGTIIDIGEWVLRRAFEDYMSWREAYEFDGIISINISPVQFKQVTFESTLYSIIREYKVPPEKVEIEITESVFVDNEFQLVEMIKRIRNNKIKVSLDDFGTGYSSLSYLKNIPADTLKIDKTFIDSLGEIKSSDIITSSVIEMMKRLGLEIIAEGVEKQEQYEFLKKMNCDDIQGFYLARPMSADLIRTVIREEKC